MNYRTTKAKVEELTREIELLEEQILNIGGISAVEADIVKISRERERFLSEVSNSFILHDAKCKILHFSDLSI